MRPLSPISPAWAFGISGGFVLLLVASGRLSTYDVVHPRLSRTRKLLTGLTVEEAAHARGADHPVSRRARRGGPEFDLDAVFDPAAFIRHAPALVDGSTASPEQRPSGKVTEKLCGKRNAFCHLRDRGPIRGAAFTGCRWLGVQHGQRKPMGWGRPRRWEPGGPTHRRRSAAP
jgi:hypothetical protein